MAKKAMSRKEALAILVGHPEARGNKPIRKLSTPVLQRKAREVQAAQREQRPYSEERGRGHAGNVSGRNEPVKHIDPQKPYKNRPGYKYLQDQFVVGKGPVEGVKADKKRGIKGKKGRAAKPPTTADVLRALDKRDKAFKKRKGTSDRLVLVVFGFFHNYNAVQGDRDETLPVVTSRSTLRNILADYPDITQAMNVLFGYPPVIDPYGPDEGWLQVYTVSILTDERAYPSLDESEEEEEE